MKKISVIMPSYNDAVSIVETLDSLIEQDYTNWELVIVDDGSTDNTKEVIQKYKEEQDKENKITYLYQQNADQLNAILNGLDHTDGDFIFILHSDDLINEKDSFTKCVAYMEEHPEITEIIGDLTTIDENSNYTGMQRVNDYKKEHYVLPLQLLWLGRNLFIDVAFHRRETFIKKVKENYVKWNTPFWMNFKAKESIEMLNVKKVDFSFYKYRIFSGNYVNSYKGKLNVINGELRTLVGLMKFYNIPAYRFQYLVYRTFNKLGLFNLYRPIYQKKEQQEKGTVVEFVIKKRFGEEYKKNRFLKVLVDFYQKQTDREVVLDKEIDADFVYQGKDNAKFNNALLADDLNEIYLRMFDEMEQGFSKVIVKNEKEKEKIENILRFLCVYPFVEVKIKEGV